MKVLLSPLAEFKLERLLESIQAKWGKKSKEKFLKKLTKTVEKISTFPEIWSEINEFPGIRKCIVSKQTSFFYRVLTDEIEIITVIDNRQAPAEIIKEVKAHFSFMEKES